MKAEVKKTTEPETEFLDEALVLAREVVALRDRLSIVQREYHELLGQRDEASREGRDILPQIRPLYLEIEELPGKILPLEQRIDWLVNQEVEKKNSENLQAAARQYMASRDNLRNALERFREEWVSIQEATKAGAALSSPLTDKYNSRLTAIESLLGRVHFSRVTYKPLNLPVLDAARVSRGDLLGAVDAWIANLH